MRDKEKSFEISDDFLEGLEIQDEIQAIVEKGVRKKENFLSYIRNMWRELGKEVLFHDRAELITVIFIIALVSLIAFRTINIYDNLGRKNQVYEYAFFYSPLILFFTSLFSLVRAIESRTLEIEYTTKYDFYKVSAFRLFVLSIITIILNTIILIITVNKNLDFLKVWIIATTGVFFFSFIILFSLIRARKKILKYAGLILWLILNISSGAMDNKIKEILFDNIPLYVHAMVALVSFLLFIRSLKELINYTRREN